MPNPVLNAGPSQLRPWLVSRAAAACLACGIPAHRDRVQQFRFPAASSCARMDRRATYMAVVQLTLRDEPDWMCRTFGRHLL